MSCLSGPLSFIGNHLIMVLNAQKDIQNAAVIESMLDNKYQI